jgi:uncharacterized protein YaaR (DUF327 family)
MAKIDITDPTVFLNPSAYSGVREEKKIKGTPKKEKTDFSGFFNELMGKTADSLGPLQNLPASDESVNILMDEVRDAGDKLKSRPLAEEIMHYKQTVRNFINYVVQNTYQLELVQGTRKHYIKGFKGERGTPDAMSQKKHMVITVIDKKLESLAAMLLSSQMRQMELLSHLEEIRGLLVDLLL